MTSIGSTHSDMSYFTKDLPFTIKLSQTMADGSVHCDRLLRCLPGKRLVFQGTWQQRDVIVKLFLDPTSERRHWSREKTGSEALMASPVPCPELIFAGQLDDGVSVLVYDFLPEAKTALDVWASLTNHESRKNLLHQLVAIVALLHESGLVQQDLHLENFLVANQQLYAIDGDAIDLQSQGKALDLEVSSSNLALLFAQLLPEYDPLIESAVLLYAQQRNISAEQLLHQLAIDLPVVRRRRRHKYVEKCYRSCSEFVQSKGAGYVSISRRDMQGGTLNRFLGDPDRFMANGTVLKDGNSSTIVRVQLDECDWVIKRYNIKNLRHAFSRCFRPTRAWVSWGNAHLLKVSGIATPRAIALLEKRIGPLRSTGYYVCDFVDGVNAEEFFQDDAVDALAKEQAAEDFVRLFELFHKLNIVHGDCKATNFLLQQDVLWVLDLDAMHECSSVSRFQRLSHTDRMRFLRNWQAQPVRQKWFDERLPR